MILISVSGTYSRFKHFYRVRMIDFLQRKGKKVLRLKIFKFPSRKINKWISLKDIKSYLKFLIKY